LSAKKVIKVGIAGIGFMGVTHFNALKSVRGARVTAIAESEPKRQAGDWSDVRGNYGKAGEKVDLSKIHVYSDYKDMARDPEVDLIDLCLPTPLHTPAVIYSLEQGKHVLCEKPIALNLKDADRMLAAAKAAGKHLFVGQVLRYFPQYRYLKKANETGQYGKLLAARFRRIISRPNWSPGGWNWFADPKKSGGATVDLHIHDVDFVLHLLGKPVAVTSRGIPTTDDALDYIVTQYDFGKVGPVITTEGGWIATAALPFEQSYEVYFEKATILFNSSNCPVTVLLPNGKRTEAKLSTEDGFVAEWNAIIKPLLAGAEPTELLGQTARESLSLCLAEQRSSNTGKTVKV
jgi:predicted dehydrogenase